MKSIVINDKKSILKYEVNNSNYQSPNKSILSSLENIIDNRIGEIYTAVSILFIPNKQYIKIKDIEIASRIISKLLKQRFPGLQNYIFDNLPKGTSIVSLANYIELIKKWSSDKEGRIKMENKEMNESILLINEIFKHKYSEIK